MPLFSAQQVQRRSRRLLAENLASDLARKALRLRRINLSVGSPSRLPVTSRPQTRFSHALRRTQTATAKGATKMPQMSVGNGPSNFSSAAPGRSARSLSGPTVTRLSQR